MDETDEEENKKCAGEVIFEHVVGQPLKICLHFFFFESVDKRKYQKLSHTSVQVIALEGQNIFAVLINFYITARGSLVVVN